MTSLNSLSLRDWLEAEPFTLAMSSGFFGFFAHAGVLSALEEEGLKPVKVRGSSAGALVGGLWASGLSADAIGEELGQLQRTDFWDPRPGFGFLKGRLFDDRLRQFLPVTRIEKCRVPVSISVFDVLSRKTEVLTSGDLAPAIRASCAVPGLFHPVWISGRPKLDGGIADRPGLYASPASERVLYHHLLPSSPWRRATGAPFPAERPGLRCLAIPGLPRVTPFTLDAGRQAFAAARSATLSSLKR